MLSKKKKTVTILNSKGKMTVTVLQRSYGTKCWLTRNMLLKKLKYSMTKREKKHALIRNKIAKFGTVLYDLGNF